MTISPRHDRREPISQGEPSSPGEPPSQGELPSQGEPSVMRYVVLGLSGGLLLLVLALAAAVIVVPKFTGAIPLTVLTSSMTPSLPPGTLVIVRAVDPDVLRVGDVATYQIEPGRRGVITHRIIAVSASTDGTRTFTFQGDANSDADPGQIVEAQIQGVVWYSVPYIGYVNNAVNGENRSWLLPVGATALFAYASYQIASGIRSSITRRRARADQTP